MKEKVCPIITQGWIVGRMSHQCNQSLNCKEALKNLPKCLEEHCALWIEECLGRKGYCGLMNKTN